MSPVGRTVCSWAETRPWAHSHTALPLHSHQRAHKRCHGCQKLGWGQRPGLGWSLPAMGRSHHQHHLLPEKRGEWLGGFSKTDGLHPTPNPTLPGKQRSQSLWPWLENGGRWLQPPGPVAFQRLPRPQHLLPQMGPQVPPLPATNKESVKDLVGTVP